MTLYRVPTGIRSSYNDFRTLAEAEAYRDANNPGAEILTIQITPEQPITE